MPDSWRRRIERANELARADERTAVLLTRYAAILGAQQTCYDALVARGERLTGSLERDLDELRPRAADAFAAVAAVAPAQAMRDAPTDASAIDPLLREGWRVSSIPFLARIVLQPYAEALAAIGRRPEGRDLDGAPERAACPFCGGPPQLAVLHGDRSADGGGRALVCATCSTIWSVRRIVCVSCGEEDERRLGYFHAAGFDHLRVDACETCRQYLKTVDLTRLGIAVPLVDEVAGAALDLWAVERGYLKIEPNLVGL